MALIILERDPICMATDHLRIITGRFHRPIGRIDELIDETLV
jgi:hypothetical protein